MLPIGKHLGHDSGDFPETFSESDFNDFGAWVMPHDSGDFLETFSKSDFNDFEAWVRVMTEEILEKVSGICLYGLINLHELGTPLSIHMQENS